MLKNARILVIFFSFCLKFCVESKFNVPYTNRVHIHGRNNFCEFFQIVFAIFQGDPLGYMH